MGTSASDGKNNGWEAGVIATRMAGGASVEERLAIFASLPHGPVGGEERLPSTVRTISYLAAFVSCWRCTLQGHVCVDGRSIPARGSWYR